VISAFLMCLCLMTLRALCLLLLELPGLLGRLAALLDDLVGLHWPALCELLLELPGLEGRGA
jgi:hypothetical protein